MKRMRWIFGLALWLVVGYGPFLPASDATMRITDDGLVFPDGTRQTTAATGTGPGSPVPRTGQTTSYRPGDDGDLQKGVPSPQPRFVDNGDSTVTDNLTGLMWVKDPHELPDNTDGKTWNDAIDFCNALTYAGYSDWYLPNRRQLFSLIDDSQWWPALPPGHPFTENPCLMYWTGTTFEGQHTRAWLVHLWHGQVVNDRKSGELCVWPVRDGQ